MARNIGEHESLAIDEKYFKIGTNSTSQLLTDEE